MVARGNFGTGIGHLLRAALNVAHQIHQALLHVAQRRIELPKLGLAHVVDLHSQIALGEFLCHFYRLTQWVDDAVRDNQRHTQTHSQNHYKHCQQQDVAPADGLDGLRLGIGGQLGGQLHHLVYGVSVLLESQAGFAKRHSSGLHVFGLNGTHQVLLNQLVVTHHRCMRLCEKFVFQLGL